LNESPALRCAWYETVCWEYARRQKIPSHDVLNNDPDLRKAWNAMIERPPYLQMRMKHSKIQAPPSYEEIVGSSC
jgi:hypothetical protein